MFDIGASELLMIVIVAIVVIGPKDMPRALRSAGRWIGKVRRMSNHFRAGVDEMIRQAEIEDMEAKWAERNKQIMAKYPTGDEPAGGAPDDLLPPQMEPLDPAEADARAEAAIARAAPAKAPEHESEPPLPLAPPAGPKDA
ncbi:Sec-independent protein translocase protein TatB [Qipengyuania sp. RANM35]|uniref:Sec-independent protein translocase protein TatB n=1 Tax=Qipengyuania sp. RANM35 TaxID=3068635 RepID=UPI0034DB19E6